MSEANRMELRKMSAGKKNTNTPTSSVLAEVLKYDVQNSVFFRMNISLMKIVFWGGTIVMGGLGLLMNIL